MAGIRKILLVSLVVIILTLALGIYVGLRNTSTYHIQSLEFDEISDNVQVYRDEYGIPTIIAQNKADLFFAQGFEYARDRLFQLEFFRLLASGEISKLAGESALNTDKYLKTLDMKKAAIQIAEKLDQEYIDMIGDYLAGMNKFIEVHQNNLPLEFILTGLKPQPWTITDALSIQGVLSQTLSIGALNREILRYKMAKAFGPELAAQIYPIFDQTAETYYLNQDYSSLELTSEDTPFGINLAGQAYDNGFVYGSNSWVVGPERSATGKPILSNDPHLALQTPSIWWQVHLVALDGSFHVEGYSLPGVPGVIIGHNEDVAWGMTNTGLDAVDIFYFVTSDDGSQYYHDDQWKDFEVIQHSIGPESAQTTYSVKWTEYGPVLDPDVFNVEDDYSYVMRWVLHENHPDDQAFKALLDLNRAENANDVVESLRYFAVPGQNFVYATVDNDIGYQFTGLVPERRVQGSGIIPQNGSDSAYGWNGFVDYDDIYRVINPSQGYFYTANEEIDPRENQNDANAFYISDLYETRYRADRIQMVLDADDSVTWDEMKNLQDDTYNLYAEEVLGDVLDEIKSGSYSEDIQERAQAAISELESWNLRMDRTEIGASIFSIFRVYFETYTFKDDFNEADEDLFNLYRSSMERGIEVIGSISDSDWFDNVTTTEVETRSDIVEMAFEEAIRYLTENVGRRVSTWTYDKLHTVRFAHPMGSGSGLLGTILAMFNEGDVPSDGSEHTVKASGDTPTPTADGEIDNLQSSGSSMRLLVEVEPTWENVAGIVTPGESQHFNSGHRSDGVEDWVEGNLHPWNFDTTREGRPDFEFIKK